VEESAKKSPKKTCTVYLRAKDGHFILGARDGRQFRFRSRPQGSGRGSEIQAMVRLHPQSNNTILEMRPVANYDAVHYVRVGTVRERAAE